MAAKRVLLVGLDPDVVDYSRYPGLSAEKLLMALRADEARLNGLGYDASICFIDRGDTAEEGVKRTLGETSYDCVLIGAGVRADPELLTLFESIINVVHAHAPNARICFNTGPTDSTEAVQRVSSSPSTRSLTQ